MELLDYKNVSNRRLQESLRYHLDLQGKRYLKTHNKSHFLNNKRELEANNKIASIRHEMRLRGCKIPRPTGSYKASVALKKSSGKRNYFKDFKIVEKIEKVVNRALDGRKN